MRPDSKDKQEEAMVYKVDGIRSVDFGVTDLKAAEKFYTEVWTLKPVAEAAQRLGLSARHGIRASHPRLASA